MKLSFKYTITKIRNKNLDIIKDLQWHVKKVCNMLLYDIREGKEKIDVNKNLNIISSKIYKDYRKNNWHSNYLHSHMLQEAIIGVIGGYKSYISLCNMYKKNKNSLRGQSRFSRFKKENIVQEIIFTKYAIRIEGNKIKLSLSKRMQEKYEVKSLNEECGVFGVWGHQEASSVTYFGLHSLQHRGQEGAGIVSNDQGKLLGHRDLGLLSEVFKDQRKLAALSGQAAIGHVRYATAGNGSVDNIQPFLFKFYDQSIGLAHNGNLTNARSLRTSLEKDGAIFHSNSDTEILMHLIRRSKKTTLLDRLKEALNEVKGGFAYLLLTEDAMIAALDPNGFRPLAIGQMKNGAYVIASETCALEVIGARFIRDVRPGEVVIIDDSGYTIDTYTTETQLAICSMEYIYFARPDSNIAGVNVHTARKNMGRNLAQEAPIDADMVVGVPNSSLSAASGYAEASGIPY